MTTNNHPRIGEVITRGARKGTFLGRRGTAFYAVQWEDEKEPVWVPSVGIDRTGHINVDLIERYDSSRSSRTRVRRKGGLRRGPRTTLGTPGGSVRQGRAGTPNDPRLTKAPVEDDEPKKEVAS